MKIHKPCIFYLCGLFTGLIALKIGGYWAIAIVAASMGFAVWLDTRTKQIGGWH